MPSSSPRWPTRAAHISLLLITTLVLLLDSSSARAQSSAPPADYQSMITDAVAAARDGRVEEALVLFRAAAQRYPNPRAFRSVGVLAFEAERYALAQDYLSRSLSAAPRAGVEPLSDEQRANVSQLVERARLLAVRLDVFAPEGTTLRVDGEAREFAEPVLLDPGPHDLVGALEGHSSWERHIELRSGQRIRVDIEFDAPPEEFPEPEPEPEPEPATTAPALVTSQPNYAPRRALIASGAILTAAGAALVILGAVDAQPALDSCLDAIDTGGSCTNQDELELARTAYYGAGGAGVGLGVALIIAGALIDPGGPDEASSLRCAPGLLSLSCSARF